MAYYWTLTKLNGWRNWMAHQIEWLTKMTGSPNWIAHQSEWLTKLNGSLSNWMTHHWKARKTEWVTIEWLTVLIGSLSNEKLETGLKTETEKKTRNQYILVTIVNNNHSLQSYHKLFLLFYYINSSNSSVSSFSFDSEPISTVSHSIVTHSVLRAFQWCVIQFESEPFSLVSHSLWWAIQFGEPVIFVSQ